MNRTSRALTIVFGSILWIACGGGGSGSGTADSGAAGSSSGSGGSSGSGAHDGGGGVLADGGPDTGGSSSGGVHGDGGGTLGDGGGSSGGDAGSPSLWEDTYDGIHYFQTFDSDVTDVATEASHTVFVWGSEQSIPAYRASSNPKIVLSYYMPWAYDQDASHDLAYWKNLHPDWILYACDKTTPAYYSGTTNMPLDVSNPAVVAWQVQTVATPASSNGYDMIAADEFQLGGWGGCGVYQNGQWKQLYSAGTGDPKADADAVAWTKAFRDALHALPHPMGLIPNFQLGGTSPTDPNVLGVVAGTDGILDECSFTQCSSGHASGQDWLDLVSFAEYVQQQGKAYMAINEVTTVTDAEVEWALASYLMSKEHASGVFVSGVQQYGSDLWRSEYAAVIGAPCGAMQSTQGAYARTFKQGIAIANPGKSSVTFTLPSGKLTDLHGATQGATVTLGPGSGVVLLASAPQC
jgi:hypothetical protein